MNKILYITPHLSTGGAPQYLLKKIELLRNIYNIYVIEYNDYGIYRVQKNKIIEIIDDKLFTLGDEKTEIFEIINQINPHVIHFEEMPEFFMNDDITKKIYSSDRKYLIYETSHDSSFESSNKRFLPDRFLFCSDNQVLKFANLNIPSSVIEYPVEKKQKKNREDALKFLNLDPEKLHVLNVGLFTPRKNQSEIIEYARRMVELPVQFHFVGNMAPNFKDYWQPILENIPNNCMIWGERDDVNNFYSCMDLFLFTSKGNSHDKETNPLSIKEALSWNMPTLIYKLDSYQDKFDNKVTYLSDDFEMNLLKILRKLKLSDNYINCYIEEESKVNLLTGDFFHVLKDKIVGLYETNSNLLMYRSKVFGPSLWITPNASPSLISGLSVRIYDAPHDYFSNLEEVDLINEHNLLYEKTFDFGNDVNVILNGEKQNFSSIKDDQASWYTMYEVFLKEIYKKIDIKKGDIVLDIGGHYGFFSLYSLEQGADHVYSFEPTKTTFDVLCKNLRNYDNAKKFNFAISDENGEKEFFTLGPSSVNSFYDSFNTDETNPTTLGKKKIESVRTMTIPTFMKNNDLDRIDVLKLDCEGEEWKILPNISDDFLKYRIRKITMEVHDFFDNDNSVESRVRRSNDLVNRLEKCNYNVIVEDEVKSGGLGNLWAFRYPKIKIVHMLVDVNGDREKESIKHLRELSNYSGWEYVQMVNGKYDSLPPIDTCARPEDVQMEPGHYKLTPAHYGNFLAHQLAMKEHLTEECDAVLFCECDAIFIKPMHEIYKQIIDRLDDLNEYDLKYMNFGKRIIDWHYQERNKYFDIASRMSEAHCYLVPCTSRDYFMQKFENTGWDTYDLWLNNNILCEMVGGITKNPFSIQCSGDSYLDKSFKDGTTLLKDGDITYVL